MNRVREFVATCLYVGHIPGAPGTYASVLAAAVFVIAGKPLGQAGWLTFLGIFLAAIFALSRAEEIFGAADPKPVVLDEFAGMWLTMLVGGSGDWVPMGIGFVLFRMLDIAKPFGIRRLERMAGWRGIIADDLAAGLAAGIAVRAAVIFIGM
jgi:phosphatidylglycerophosphatase A